MDQGSKSLKIFGGPGTGKTRAVIGYMKEASEAGHTVTYVTFSRAMAQDARERAHVSRKIRDPVTAGTVHSVLSQVMGLTKSNYLKPKHIASFFESRGIEFFPSEAPSDVEALAAPGLTLGARILSEFDGHRHAYRSLSPVEDYEGDLEHLYDAYQSMKRGRMDYTDILEAARDDGASPGSEVFLVDEYQDMTPLMRDATQAAERDASRVIIAGDDDQAIYGFMGASPSLMLDHPGEEQILRTSYRCKEKVLASALAALRVIPEGERKEKRLWGKPGGYVEGQFGFSGALHEALRHGGSLYILLRINRWAKQVAGMLLGMGVAFGSVNRKKWNLLSPWTEKMQGINNALAAFRDVTEPEILDARRLVKAIPASLLIRGAKTAFDRRAKAWEKGGIEAARPSLYEVFETRPTPGELLTQLNPKEFTERAKNAIQRRGIRPISQIRVFVDTKHAAKGREADTVISVQAIPRMIQRRVRMGDVRAEYEEARLEYVARSRARDRLYLVQSL